MMIRSRDVKGKQIAINTEHIAVVYEYEYEDNEAVGVEMVGEQDHTLDEYGAILIPLRFEEFLSLCEAEGKTCQRCGTATPLGVPYCSNCMGTFFDRAEDDREEPTT